MRAETRQAIRSFSIELGVYGALVTAYFFAVLHFLGGWLKFLFDDHRTWFAFVALALVVAQGVLLEMLTTALLKIIRREDD